MWRRCSESSLRVSWRPVGDWRPGWERERERERETK